MVSCADPTWPREFPPPGLEADRIHVWRISLEATPTAATAYRACLTAEEQTRADRFRFEHHRQRFIQSRGSLRYILGQYVSQPAASLRFAYEEYGKPFLADFPEVSFNLSHSESLALCAVSRRRRLGVDLEVLREFKHFSGLRQRCLSVRESHDLDQLPPAQVQPTFLQYWTCKEAYLKATGRGLSESLQALEVQLTPQPRFLQVSEAGDWHLRRVDPAPGFVAALVSEGEAGVDYLDYWDNPEI